MKEQRLEINILNIVWYFMGDVNLGDFFFNFLYFQGFDTEFIFRFKKILILNPSVFSVYNNNALLKSLWIDRKAIREKSSWCHVPTKQLSSNLKFFFQNINLTFWASSV